MGHKPNVLHTFSDITHISVPDNEPWQIELNDPAISAMTDFRERALFKVSPEELIVEALQKMKVAGLRLGFVIDDKSENILGSITAYDIMGEKPMRFQQNARVNHKDIKVKDIMENVSDWVCVEMKNVNSTTIQSVLNAFQKTGRTHIPVIDTKEGSEHRLCGLFSSSKVLRLTDFARSKVA